jgi:hypothetical protein
MDPFQLRCRLLGTDRASVSALADIPSKCSVKGSADRASRALVKPFSCAENGNGSDLSSHQLGRILSPPVRPSIHPTIPERRGGGLASPDTMDRHARSSGRNACCGLTGAMLAPPQTRSTTYLRRQCSVAVEGEGISDRRSVQPRRPDPCLRQQCLHVSDGCRRPRA